MVVGADVALAIHRKSGGKGSSFAVRCKAFRNGPFRNSLRFGVWLAITSSPHLADWLKKRTESCTSSRPERSEV